MAYAKSGTNPLFFHLSPLNVEFRLTIVDY